MALAFDEAYNNADQSIYSDQPEETATISAHHSPNGPFPVPRHMSHFDPTRSGISMQDVQNPSSSSQHYTFDTDNTSGNRSPVMNDLNMSQASHLQQSHSRNSSAGNLQQFQSAPSSPNASRAQQRYIGHAKGALSLPHVAVVFVTPTFGCFNSQVKVVINVQPNPAMPIRSFRVVFGSIDATTRVAFEDRSSSVERVELVANSPRLLRPYQSGRVAMIVQAVDANDVVLATADAGSFDYVEPMPYGYPSPDMSRKRSGEPLDSERVAPRPPGFEFTHFSPSMHTSPRFSHSPFSPALGQSPRLSNGSRPSSSPQLSMSMSGRSDSGMFPSSNLNDSTMMDSEPSQWDPAGQNNGPTLEQPPDSQAAALPEQGDGQGNEDEMDDDDMSINPNAGTHTSSVLRHPPLPSAEESAGQPMLIRSSQLPPVSKRPKGLTSAKVVVQFEGDLDDMARGWSQEEWTARRRLVQFIRVQDKNVIKASFAPVRQVDFKTTDIVISCIFRDDKNECFVTSVDAIYLLEGIVGIRFSVEEKNRIRRNLEGFKPITVSKSKADSEAYFKLIMGFPNPKPRNIEKDVKVFPWKIIANAVKKIVGKYSATFSNAAEASTAVPSPPDLPQPKRGRRAATKTSKGSKASGLSISTTSEAPLESDQTPTATPSLPNDPTHFSYPSPPSQQQFDFSSLLHQNSPSSYLHEEGHPSNSRFTDQHPVSGLFGLGSDFGHSMPSFMDQHPQHQQRPSLLMTHSHGHHRSHSDLGFKTSQNNHSLHPASSHQRHRSWGVMPNNAFTASSLPASPTNGGFTFNPSYGEDNYMLGEKNGFTYPPHQPRRPSSAAGVLDVSRSFSTDAQPSGLPM